MHYRCRLHPINEGKHGLRDFDEVPHLQIRRAVDICGDRYAHRADSSCYLEQLVRSHSDGRQNFGELPASVAFSVLMFRY